MERLSRLIADHRRALCAAFAALATLAAIAAVRETPELMPVTVAARDLPSGHLLTADDVTTAEVPAAAAVETVTESEGRQVAGAMRAGEPITDRRVVDPRAVGDGLVLASVHVDPSVAALLRPGDRVDVVSITEESGVDGLTLAEGAVVALVQEGDEGTTVGLETDPATAGAIARAAVVGRFTLVPSAS